MIEKGADVNSVSNENKSLLSTSIQNANSKFIIILLMNDAKIFDLEHLEISQQFLTLFSQVYSINEDMNNLLKSTNNLKDLQIQSNDSSKFQVHKPILLTRFDNNESILQKFIDICSQKSKEEVEILLNFLYTGFPDFDQYRNQFIIQNESGYTYTYEYPDFDMFPDDYPFESDQTNPRAEELKQISENENENENRVISFFEEIGFDLNWVNEKKGRKGIIKDLSKLYQENETKDFRIICEEKEIKVHKLILILRSELFKGMFELNIQDQSNQVHDYSGKSFETINQFIYFLYNDEFEEEIKINKEFYDLKDYFQLNPNSIIDLILN
ncbi:hypothetical protein M0811_08535 [Anaeramoeba ignava]|uniref:BTB domain-containing protein n=1 Tax=Anaeramoeba ignava TaxID=1746090 RepID=A0A9Q0LJ05_ANAIG|nr:hypothetical protein M0811_08535 [Anaeramoeba ignava]